eukprot:GFKZ01002727.1.p1 GENE.GFKZ01002727.1~~GFKZ01002727.1.p1  ORF type:complete len:124 (-),score=4.05 GFKZ01002727.1:1024-1395(-)
MWRDYSWNRARIAVMALYLRAALFLQADTNHTVSSPFQRSLLFKGGWEARAATNEAERLKMMDLTTKVVAIPGEALSEAGRSTVGWHFAPLAFDSVGSPSWPTPMVIDNCVDAIASRIENSTA